MCQQPGAEEGYPQEARKLLDTLPPVAGMTDPVVAMAEVGEEARASAILKQELAQHPTDTLWTDIRGPQIQAVILLAQHERRRPSMRYSLRCPITFAVSTYRSLAAWTS